MSDETANLTVPDFLLARIAEDEEAAREPRGLRRWKIGPGPAVRTADGDRLVNVALETLPRQRTALAAHIARHDPARVLAECEAKRRIVRGLSADFPGPHGLELVLTEILQALALPYADHPDYRDEWRP